MVWKILSSPLAGTSGQAGTVTCRRHPAGPASGELAIRADHYEVLALFQKRVQVFPRFFIGVAFGMDVVVAAVRGSNGAGEYHRMSLFGCRLGGLDEPWPVIAHAVA